MRNKDGILLENCYNKVQKVLVKEGVEDMEFTAQVDLDYIDTDSPEVKKMENLGVQDRATGSNNKREKLTVKYKIDLEYRTYGIKDIYAYGFKLEPFVFTVMDEEFEEKAIKEIPAMDLPEAQFESNASEGKYFYPTSIKLFVDKDLKVIPQKCIVNFN